MGFDRGVPVPQSIRSCPRQVVRFRVASGSPEHAVLTRNLIPVDAATLSGKANSTDMEPAPNSSTSKPASTATKRLRSRVSNGKKAFVEGDGRSPWARRWRDLIESHVADLGGVSVLSEAQRSLIKRASTIEIELEQIEGRLSLGRAADLGEYATAASHLRRIFETLGITRVPRLVDGVTINNNNELQWSPLRAHLHDEQTERLRTQLEMEPIP
jgi:hypothetical protein